MTTAIAAPIPIPKLVLCMTTPVTDPIMIPKVLPQVILLLIALAFQRSHLGIENAM
jgi:hypothetical protein